MARSGHGGRLHARAAGHGAASATHLFHDGELAHGLRNLSDLDLLLRRFVADPAFWDALLAGADKLTLGRPLLYALACLVSLLGTPVPAAVQRCADIFPAPPREG